MLALILAATISTPAFPSCSDPSLQTPTWHCYTQDQASRVMLIDPKKPSICFDGTGIKWPARVTPKGSICLMSDKPK